MGHYLVMWPMGFRKTVPQLGLLYGRGVLLSHFSRVRLSATPWTEAHQALLSLGFSRQEHWSGLPFPSPMEGEWIIIKEMEE